MCFRWINPSISAAIERLTVARMIDDGIEVVEFLRSRLGKETIVSTAAAE
jgi:hypothetical protein